MSAYLTVNKCKLRELKIYVLKAEITDGYWRLIFREWLQRILTSDAPA